MALIKPKCPCTQNCDNRNAFCKLSCAAWKEYEGKKFDFYEKRIAENEAERLNYTRGR